MKQMYEQKVAGEEKGKIVKARSNGDLITATHPQRTSNRKKKLSVKQCAYVPQVKNG